MKPQLTSLLAIAALAAAGCTQNSSQSDNTAGPSTTSIDGSAYVLSNEPAGAAPVIAVREQSKDGDEVVLVGRIGGSANPWIEGRAAFSIVDPSLKACSDIPGDECPKPWDYCCEATRLPSSTALIKFVDDKGRPLQADARKLLSLKELQTVVVSGKAQRDAAGNLTVLATGLYVRPAAARQESRDATPDPEPTDTNDASPPAEGST